MTPSIEERVAKGAALMDENVPGWAERIDTKRLEMSSCMDCVLGQAFSIPKQSWTIFGDACAHLGLDTDECEDVAYGFNGGGGCNRTNELASLRSAWLDEIARRLPQGPEATS